MFDLHYVSVSTLSGRTPGFSVSSPPAGKNRIAPLMNGRGGAKFRSSLISRMVNLRTVPPCPGNLPSLAAMSIPGFIFRAGRVMPEQGLLHAPVPFSRKTACFRPASLGGSFTHGERGCLRQVGVL